MIGRDVDQLRAAAEGPEFGPMLALMADECVLVFPIVPVEVERGIGFPEQFVESEVIFDSGQSFGTVVAERDCVVALADADPAERLSVGQAREGQTRPKELSWPASQRGDTSVQGTKFRMQRGHHSQCDPGVKPRTTVRSVLRILRAELRWDKARGPQNVGHRDIIDDARLFENSPDRTIDAHG
jgi:hypothetical protein